MKGNCGLHFHKKNVVAAGAEDGSCSLEVSVSLSDLICSNSRSAEAQLNFSNLYTSFRSDMSFINIIFDVKSLQN